MRTNKTKQLTRSLLAAACALTCVAAHAVTATPTGAKIIITSRDAPGTGFDDRTPVAPVGGNPGTTLGEQRYNVYRYVADIWEKNLTSSVPITVSAGWEALTCTSQSAVLGSAGAWNIWHDTPGTKAGTWYAAALANKLAGVDLTAGTPDDGSGYGNVDIKTQFNVNLGQPGCLDNRFFYLGFDGNAGSNVNFVETLLHELGHGLGFSVISVNTSTGQRINAQGNAYVTNGGLPSVWEEFMFDNSQQKSWLTMSSAERKISAVTPFKLAWTGPNVVAGQGMLGQLPYLRVTANTAAYSGIYDYNPAVGGPTVPTTGPFGKLVPVAAQAGGTGPGCDTYSAANAAAVRGNVAIIARGTCTFAVKAGKAQDAGAVGVILTNNVEGALIPSVDGTIRIPTVGVSLADGNRLLLATSGGSRSAPAGATAVLAMDAGHLAGADVNGHPLLYTPGVLASGSSVSHWDTSASPNLLMEPNINADLGTVLVAPKDLTVPLLKDIGW